MDKMISTTDNVAALDRCLHPTLDSIRAAWRNSCRAPGQAGTDELQEIENYLGDALFQISSLAQLLRLKGAGSGTTENWAAKAGEELRNEWLIVQQISLYLLDRLQHRETQI